MSSVEVVSSSCVEYVEHLCLEKYLYFVRNVSESNLNGSFWNKVSTFLLSDWLNEKEHAVNLNTCSWRVQEKAGFMKSRWLFFTTDQWIRNGRNLKSQRICRGNLMFFSDVPLRCVSQLEIPIHLFRRLELRNDSIKRNDKARHENDESRRSQFVSLS